MGRRGPTPQSKKEISKITWEKAWIKRGRSVVRGAWGTWSPREARVCDVRLKSGGVCGTHSLMVREWVMRGIGLGEGTHDHLKELTKAHVGMGNVNFNEHVS